MLLLILPMLRAYHQQVRKRYLLRQCGDYVEDVSHPYLTMKLLQFRPALFEKDEDARFDAPSPTSRDRNGNGNGNGSATTLNPSKESLSVKIREDPACAVGGQDLKRVPDFLYAYKYRGHENFLTGANSAGSMVRESQQADVSEAVSELLKTHPLSRCAGNNNSLDALLNKVRF